MTNTPQNDGIHPVVRPRTDVLETEGRIELVLEMPGVDQASVEVTWTEDVLTVRGTPAREPDAGWRAAGWRTEWSEFELRPYERALRITSPIERDSIQASIQDGLLWIVLPKRKPRSSKIEVTAA